VKELDSSQLANSNHSSVTLNNRPNMWLTVGLINGHLINGRFQTIIGCYHILMILQLCCQLVIY